MDEKMIGERLRVRFTRYARICTTSDRHAAHTPTSEGQWELARLLAEELRGLGVADVELTAHCYVIARVPAANADGAAPVIAFLAHLDTSSEVSGRGVNVIAESYEGGLVPLSDGLVLDPACEEGLATQKGKIIIHSDGKTLLGADDKAGIAEIMTALEYLLSHPELPRPPLEILFSPDEETGKGLPELPREALRARFCYTLDGGAAPEIETECFNAYAATVSFTGKVFHPGAARGRLVNAASMAAFFVTLLPRSESPEATDGYYGYYCVTEMAGTHEASRLEIIIRDFERVGIERRLAALEVFARTVEAAFPGGTVHIVSEESYANMKEKIDTAPEACATLREAGRALGVELCKKPIRGGTDGARLTELGIPTPNIFTGGRNFHSRLEWAALDEMVLATRLVIELARLWAHGGAL
jgi:tripeptide aminopeptidase